MSSLGPTSLWIWTFRHMKVWRGENTVKQDFEDLAFRTESVTFGFLPFILQSPWLLFLLYFSNRKVVCSWPGSAQKILLWLQSCSCICSSRFWKSPSPAAMCFMLWIWLFSTVFVKEVAQKLHLYKTYASWPKRCLPVGWTSHGEM